MSKLACIILLVLTTAVGAVPQETAIGAESRGLADQEHAKWIDQVMRSISTIKPGMTRKDLFTVFTEEGGISTRRQRRYVYKHCPYIKVDVEFSAEEMSQGATTESSEDRIVKISRPYLQYAIGD